MKNILFIISVSFALFQSNVVIASLDSNDQKAIIVDYSTELGLFLNHEVGPKETIYGLSKLSRNNVDELCVLNNISKDQPLPIGTSLIIPINVNTIITNKSELSTNEQYKNVLYKVKPKDNLFQIAKRYFNQEVQALKSKNNLPNNDISPDQELLVGWFAIGSFHNFTPTISHATGVQSVQKGPSIVINHDQPSNETSVHKEVIVEEVVNNVSRAPQTLEEFQKETGFSKMPIDTVSVILGSDSDLIISSNHEGQALAEHSNTKNINATTTETPGVVAGEIVGDTDVIQEEVLDESLFKDYRQTKGIAVWDKENEDNGKYFVLHRMAKVGSTMQVINPMLGRMVQAKVISNFPPNVYPDDVKLVVSGSIAKVLGVIDGRFLVEMKYLPNYK